MTEMERPFSLRLGTGSGTLPGVTPTILSFDIARTMILAAVGATISFNVSFLLQRHVKPKE